MSKIKDMHLSPKAFTKMRNLILLKFYDSSWIKKYSMDCSRHPPYHSKVHFGEGLSDLSDKLRSLIWLGYPLPALPSNFNPDNLVELDLRHSNVERLWEDSMHAPKLKRLILGYCTRLTKISGLLKSPLIEEIDIRYCSSLLDFPQLDQHVNNLRDLFMKGCKSLRSFPSDIHFEYISSLDLHGCRGLRFTHSSGLPCSLRSLCLSDCNLKEIPEDIFCFPSLLHLDLSENHFEHLPKSMKQLRNLNCLKLNNCNMLQSLTELPSSLILLCASDCKRLRSIPDASEFAEIIRYEGYCTVFIFTNCLKLEAAVGNMLEQLRKYLNKESGILDLCYSGSEVPEWFIYRTEGSSIKFGVPEWHKLLGFAVCAVIAFEEYCYVGAEDELDDFGDEDFGDTLEGLYGSASKAELGLIMVFNFGFTEGMYKGRSISILGFNSAMNPVREMSIVGGTVIFRLARGYAIAQTNWFDPASGDAIVGYNITIVH
ncbi:hypothetical protein LWI29_027966 [Acer saccharum]|uniref:Dirigent protein n=1 Tax=Acer saccharum TaxID=4024 RepID=A0AA39RZX7_ACESA|nr:hypothetical protein LWI29_027966 [Acer saccharum]